MLADDADEKFPFQKSDVSKSLSVYLSVCGFVSVSILFAFNFVLYPIFYVRFVVYTQKLFSLSFKYRLSRMMLCPSDCVTTKRRRAQTHTRVRHTQQRISTIFSQQKLVIYPSAILTLSVIYANRRILQQKTANSTTLLLIICYM